MVFDVSVRPSWQSRDSHARRKVARMGYGLAIHHAFTYPEFPLPGVDRTRRTEQAANKTPTSNQGRENSTAQRSAYANIDPFP